MIASRTSSTEQWNKGPWLFGSFIGDEILLSFVGIF